MKAYLIAGALALAAAAPAVAHHSFAMFDLTKDVPMSGTIKEVQFTNPHVWFQVMAPDASGKEVEWSIEAGAPGMLLRTGWKPNTVKPGDKVSLVMHPAKSGKPTGSLVTMKVPDGRTLGPGGAPKAE
jgi:hypothetical protein